jgi:hypothetical protein
MLRFQLPPRPESLNHIPIPYVNNLSAKLMDGKPRAGSLEIKFAPFIHGMKNLCQNISRIGNSIVYVPPAREKESRIMLTTFYRTASYCPF